MTSTVKERRAARRIERERKEQLAALRSERRAVGAPGLHWGTPWCSRPGGPYCGGPTCEGCAIAKGVAAEVADLDRRIADLLNPPPAPLEGELMSMVGGRWVTA